MVPLVGSTDELANQLAVIHGAAKETIAAAGEGVSVPYKVGTMIETPRACIVAAALAESCDFFSFGTNDLTQLTLGFSRDDAEAHFLAFYARHGVIAHDPFERLDEAGVGALLRQACAAALPANRDLSLGVCGEHGGDPTSIAFFDATPGMAYVSCSPLRVPVARLAAAQAALQHLKIEA
jgi:pyruvate, orthophosphate dikinase